MNTNSTKRVVFSNFLWRFAERTGAQIVQFIVSIVLARVLLPEAYGTVALMTVFIQILQVFVDSGLGNALIQCVKFKKQKINEKITASLNVEE